MPIIEQELEGGDVNAGSCWCSGCLQGVSGRSCKRSPYIFTIRFPYGDSEIALQKSFLISQESNHRMAETGDQDRYIHLKDISVDFIKQRPTSSSILELVIKNDDSDFKFKSNIFKEGNIIHWNLDILVKIHTTGTLTIRQGLFKIRIAKISVGFEPSEFGDNRAVTLEDSSHRVAVNFVCGISKSAAFVTSCQCS
ncbi:hypothetical protein EI94DRAFT_775822 [Lactarius quietus]|nr:hypothetical protein EI94DRAFT_775822 [Lactarius quietus]